MNHLSFHVLRIGASGPDQRQSSRSRPEPHGLLPIRTLIVVIDYISVILALSERWSQAAEIAGLCPVAGTILFYRSVNHLMSLRGSGI
jgi:hypothetical protein